MSAWQEDGGQTLQPSACSSSPGWLSSLHKQSVTRGEGCGAGAEGGGGTQGLGWAVPGQCSGPQTPPQPSDPIVLQWMHWSPESQERLGQRLDLVRE